MKNKQTSPNVESKIKRGRKPDSIPFPRKPFKECLKIARIIWENGSGESLKLLDIASTLQRSPTSGSFATLIRATKLYGLTDTSFSQDTNRIISLTNLAKSIISPTSETNVNDEVIKSLFSERIFSQLFNKLEGKIIPPENIFKSDLSQIYNIPLSDTKSLYDTFIQNVQDLHLYTDLGGKRYLRKDLIKFGDEYPTNISPGINEDSDGSENSDSSSVVSPEPEKLIQKPKKIFIAHGKNKAPLKVITDFLTAHKIPFVVAIDEPHTGRPISQKVIELMDECTSGIFIFTKEIAYTSDDKEAFLPNLNVIYELGAASKLYNDKIIIFKEQGIDFGSDFDDLGYITFDPNNLEAQIQQLLKELVSMDFIEIVIK